jgi:hypothetical protein
VNWGPKGIHVAHVVIDGQIGEAEGDAKLKPADIAEAIWSLYRQPRSAWTLEADLRNPGWRVCICAVRKADGVCCGLR